MSESKFPSLDVSRAEEESGGHFWASFADLMTVVVMIFLMVLIVVLARNWELIGNLQKTTLQAEQSAAEANRRLLENQQLSTSLDDKNTEVSDLQRQLVAMQRQVEAQQEETRLLNREIELRVSDLARHQTDLTLREQQIADLRTEKEQLQKQVSGQQSAVEELLASVSERDSQLAELHSQLTLKVEDYDLLKTKYEKLIRPARTAKGKVIVEVSLTKSAGKEVIRIKPPNSEQAQVVSRTQMHDQLATLKNQHPGKLYVRILFPESSQLSHTEAWRFTSMLLEKYDYYRNVE